VRRMRIPIAGAVVAVLLIAAYAFGFHRPRSDAIAQAGADVQQLRSEQTALQNEIAVLEEVQDRQPELQAALDRLEGLIPSELAHPDVLAQLRAAAGEAGVKLTSVAIGQPEIPEGAPPGLPGTTLVKMDVTASVDGAFAGVTELFRRVEAELTRAVLVGTVALTEAEAGFPEITGTWSGSAYALLPVDHPLLVDPDAPPTDAEGPQEAP
jgi:Tfp pilus assembly protein PilO